MNIRYYTENSKIFEIAVFLIRPIIDTLDKLYFGQIKKVIINGMVGLILIRTKAMT